jgi:hypothetical protein
MKKQFILAMTMLASSIYTQNDVQLIPQNQEASTTFDFSGLNNANLLTLFQDPNSNIYDSLSKHWSNISATLGSIFFSDIVPFAIQIQTLMTKLKNNSEFQNLINTNLTKSVQLVAPLFTQIVDKAANIAGYQPQNETAEVID